MPPTETEPLKHRGFSEEKAQPCHDSEATAGPGAPKSAGPSWRHLKDGKFAREEEACQKGKWKMDVERNQDESFPRFHFRAQ